MFKKFGAIKKRSMGSRDMQFADKHFPCYQILYDTKKKFKLKNGGTRGHYCCVVGRKEKAS